VCVCGDRGSPLTRASPAPPLPPSYERAARGMSPILGAPMIAWSSVDPKAGHEPHSSISSADGRKTTKSRTAHCGTFAPVNWFPAAAGVLEYHG